MTFSVKLEAPRRDVKLKLTLILHWHDTAIRFRAGANICFMLLSLQRFYPIVAREGTYTDWFFFFCYLKTSAFCYFCSQLFDVMLDLGHSFFFFFLEGHGLKTQQSKMLWDEFDLCCCCWLVVTVCLLLSMCNKMDGVDQEQAVVCIQLNNYEARSICLKFVPVPWLLPWLIEVTLPMQ